MSIAKRRQSGVNHPDIFRYENPPTKNGGYGTWFCLCKVADCGFRAGVHIAYGVPVEVLVKKFRGKGWDINGRHNYAVCPNCLKEPRTIPSNENGENIMANNPRGTSAASGRPLPPPIKAASAPMSTPSVVPVEPVSGDTLSIADRMKEVPLKVQRQIFGLLEAHFDEKTMRYHNGYSDQSIAAEMAVPRVVIEHMREEAYGKIELTARQKLSADIDALSEMIQNEIARVSLDFEDTIKGLRTRLDQLPDNEK